MEKSLLNCQTNFQQKTQSLPNVSIQIPKTKKDEEEKRPNLEPSKNLQEVGTNLISAQKRSRAISNLYTNDDIEGQKGYKSLNKELKDDEKIEGRWTNTEHKLFIEGIFNI